ncbi:UNVERIFIED_CONTAM: hypothetical protein RMT77_009266 [Armadillidium vulgare]
MERNCCGLIVATILNVDTAVVELVSSNVEVKVNGFVASMSVQLSYKNYSDQTVEVVYICPLDVKTAFYDFEAKLDGRTITAHCMEKNKAKEVYDEAVEEGHAAILGSEDRFSGDLIHLTLGNLPKGESADLKLKMVKELSVRTDGAVDFVLPTIFNPRYTPANQPSGPDCQSYFLNCSVFPNRTPYSLHVKAEIEGSFKIAQIKSFSDRIYFHIDENQTSAKVTQDGGTNFDHDWSFQIYYNTVHKPNCLQMSGDRTSTGLMKDDIIMLNLFPEVPLESYSPHKEIILVIDRSGSMRGSKIAKAKNTLLLLLKSLPSECRFNVVSFGGRFETLFESSSECYTEKNLNEALELQKTIDADMGGTEIFAALLDVYSKNLIPGFPRQIIILTDGEVWNQDQIFDIIERHADETRVFAVGIGDGASTALVEGMATAGKGRHEMVAHEDQLQIRVMGLMVNMLQDCIKDLNVECKVSPPQDVKLVPKIPPNVFGGRHLILYARLKPNSKIESVKVGWKTGEDQFNCELKEDDCKSVHDSNFSFHRLAAKAQLIQWLKEEDGTVNEDVINLSISSSVVCRLTAFVGFDQDKKIIKEIEKEDPGQKLRCMVKSLMLRDRDLSDLSCRDSRYTQKFYRCKNSPGFKIGTLFSFPGNFFRSLKKKKETFSNETLSNAAPSSVQYSSASSSLLNARLKNSYQSKSDAEKDVLIDIVSAQRFDGFWTLQYCISVLNFSEEICNSIETKFSLSDNLLGTVLVLAYLELKFNSRKEEWIFVAQKGQKFLETNNVDPCDTIPKCLLEIKDKV